MKNTHLNFVLVPFTLTLIVSLLTTLTVHVLTTGSWQLLSRLFSELLRVLPPPIWVLLIEDNFIGMFLLSLESLITSLLLVSAMMDMVLLVMCVSVISLFALLESSLEKIKQFYFFGKSAIKQLKKWF